MKQVFGLILLIIICFCSFDGIGQAYVGKISERELIYQDETYEFDLDGDGKEESIKQNSYKEKDGYFYTKLYINNELVYEDKNLKEIDIHFSDFNKRDKNKELCITTGYNEENLKTTILMYDKNGNKIYNIKGRILSYDNKTGLIKFEYGNSSDSSFKSFDKALGGNGVTILYNYKAVFNKSIDNREQKRINVVGESDKVDYKVVEPIKSYKTVSGNKEAFIINAGEKVNLVTLYKSRDKQYVKIKNKDGQSAWVKIGCTKLFEIES
ncbi:MAG: hypothetical protein RSD36_13065 [Terrisporobacter sp.]